MRKSLLVLGVITSLALSAASYAADITVSQPDFSDSSRWSFAGSASAVTNQLELTNNSSTDQAGAAHYKIPFEIGADTSFDAEFELAIGPHGGGGGADGMTLTIHGQAGFPVGNSGSDLGAVGISPGVSVVFDTFDNTAKGVRVCVTSDGACVNGSGLAPSFDMAAVSSFYSWVDYDGTTNTLSVYVSTLSTKPMSPLLTQSVDLGLLLGATPGEPAFFAFTAGTGGLTSRHAVSQLSLTVTDQLDADGDQIPDRFDEDADGDGVSDVVECGEDPYGDADGDGLENYRDLDRDNDLVAERPDTNGDGIDDTCDADLDGVPNHLDLDSDADRVPDSIEAHDVNGDGLADVMPSMVDADHNGLDDAYDVGQGGAAAPLPDADMDGNHDYLDAKNLLVTVVDATGYIINAQTLMASGDVTVDVSNAGVTASAGPVSVRLFIDRDSDGVYSALNDTSLGVVSTAGPLAGFGDSAQVSFIGLSANADFKDQPVLAQVDALEEVAEVDELDNISSSAQTRCGASSPDLSVARLGYDLSASPTLGTLSVRVGNAGTAAVAANTLVAFYDGDPLMGGALIGVAQTAGALAPGEYEQLSLMWSMVPVLTPLGGDLYVVADDDGAGMGALAECSESNNIQPLTYPVGASVTSPAAGAQLNVAVSSLSGDVQGAASVDVVLRDQANMTTFSATGLKAVMGQWSVSLGALNLADGVYSISVIAMDEQGNLGQPVTTTFSLDTLAPTVTLSAPTQGALLNDRTPNITGRVDDLGAMVTIVIKDDQGATIESINASPDAQGDFSVDAMTLADGAYRAEVVAADAVGNVSALAGADFSVDATAPQVSFSAPTSGQLLNDATPTISGSVDDAAATLTIVIKDTQSAIVQSVSASVNAQGGFSVDAMTLADGEYRVEIAAVDAANNMSLAGPRQFFIDATAPTLTVTGPVDRSISNNDVPLVNGSVELGVALLLEVFDDTGALVYDATPQINASGGWSQLVDPLDNGAHVIKVSATDAAGNVTIVTRNYTVDTVSPSLTITTPASQSSTKETRPTITGSTERGLMVQVSILDDANMVVFTQSVAADAQGDFTATSAVTLSEGDYTVRASATDLANNSGATSSTFTVDTTAPAVSITSPTNNSVIANPRPTIRGNAEGGANLTITLRDAQGATVKSSASIADVASGSWSMVLDADLGDGLHSVEVIALDAASNSAQVNSRFTVDTTALPLSITAPTQDQSLADQTPTIEGTTQAAQIVSWRVLDAQGAQVQSGMATADAQGQWSFTPTTLPEGVYTVEAQVQNQAGTISTESVSLRVDVTAPLLALDAPADMSLLNDAAPMLSGRSEPGLVVSLTLTALPNTTILSTSVTANAQGRWQLNAPLLADGAYTIALSTADAAGNTSSAQGGFSVDTTPPALAIVSPRAGSVSSTRDVIVLGGAEPGVTIELELRDAQDMILNSAQVVVGANGQWSETLNMLADGLYVLHASTTDGAGNQSSVTVNFSVDSMLPMVTISAPLPMQRLQEVRPVLSGTGSADAVVTVRLSDSAAMVILEQEVMLDAQGAWSITPEMDLAQGAYTLRATAVRPNATSATTMIQFFIDLSAPTVSITLPAVGAITNTTSMMVTGQSEPNAVVTVTLQVGQEPRGTAQVRADQAGEWGANFSSLTDGEYLLVAVAEDEAGNISDPAERTFIIDTMAPSLSITSPVADSVIMVARPLIEGTVEPGLRVDVSVDGELYDTVDADAQGAWSVQVIEPLSPGDHTVSAVAKDPAGNVAMTGTQPFTVRLPWADVTITDPMMSIPAGDVVIRGTGEPGQMITVTLNADSVQVNVEQDGSWEANFKEVAPGQASVTATDGQSSATLTLEIVARDDEPLVFKGGGCQSTHGAPGVPAHALLWFVVFGLVWARRRLK